MTEPAFEFIPGAGKLLLLCDHAANALPTPYGMLGLEPRLFQTHIAYDIGAAAVTRALAASYGAAEVARRIAQFHAPYHAAIAAEIDKLDRPTLISFHSFTPAWKGQPRPWEVGVLWDEDGRLAKPLMARLAEAGFVVGDNEPYSGALEGDTLNIHGTKRGLPHVLIEMRQDLIATEGSAKLFAARLKPVLDAALTDMG